jgi:hypothetical protein
MQLAIPMPGLSRLGIHAESSPDLTFSRIPLQSLTAQVSTGGISASFLTLSTPAAVTKSMV